MKNATGIGEHQGMLSLPELRHRLPFPLLSRTQVGVANKIGDRLIYTKELLEMNLKRSDASPDELFREEPQPGSSFIRQTAEPAYTTRRDQEAAK
jgi:hypothetical protein